MRDPRTGRRMSTAPRMSVAFSPIQLHDINNMADEQEGSKRGSLKNFCCNHIKSIVTVIMVFGMVFCVVMIVMVHKWNYETNESNYAKGCMDVAVIGSGIAGSYAAWKLRGLGLKVHLYEMSDHVGGLLHTMHLSEYPELDLELGVMSYNPQQQSLLADLIHALQLQPLTSHPPNPAPPTLYLRGCHMTVADLRTNKIPYNLTAEERQKDPEALTNYYKNLILGKESYTNKNWLPLVTKDGLHLYKQGYQNSIGKFASTEGKNFLYDTVRWRHLTTNDNAAQLLAGDWDVHTGAYKESVSLEGGMQSLPQALVDQFLNASSSNHSIELNHRLACIRIKHGLYQLIFIKTKNINGNILDLPDSSEVCTNKVILAVPQKSLRRIEWKPFDSELKYKQSLNSVQEYPVIRVFFIYSTSELWRDALYRKDIYTDLPIRHYKYLGAQTHFNKSEQHHVFMVAEVEAKDLDYIKSLIDLRSFDGENMTKCNDTNYLVADITKHIAKLCGADISDMPMPEHVVIIDWTRNRATGSWYNWKRGIKWDYIDKNMTKPQFFEDVYFAGGLLRDNMNTVLKNVNNVIEDYFIKTQ